MMITVAIIIVMCMLVLIVSMLMITVSLLMILVIVFAKPLGDTDNDDCGNMWWACL